MPIPSQWFSELHAFVRIWTTAPDPLLRAEHLGDAPFLNFVLSEHAASWDDYAEWLTEFDSAWVFRGQRESSWLLHTSLDRAVRVTYSGVDQLGYHHNGHDHLDREAVQHALWDQFRKDAPQYLSDVPAPDDLASWLALMQHHGAPTRLLDWTHSPHVACYFALAEEPREDTAALWALDLQWLRERCREALPGLNAGDSREDMNNVLRETKATVIVPIVPAQPLDRAKAQQGILLCKLFHQATFSQILMSMMLHPSLPTRPVIRRLTIDRRLRIQVLTRLRDMGVHSASLFPGLDGLGRSLKINLEIKVQHEQAAAFAS